MERREVPQFLQKRRNDEKDSLKVRVETRTLMPMWRSKEDIYKFFTE
jgi:hypothetical protein